MSLVKIKIAIISDLHCHPEMEKFSDNNTLLYSDKLRSPTKEHPVASLLEIIAKQEIKVDFVLSPGDFADHCNRQGFLSGWSYVNEMARAMQSKSIIATIGNHDIDSRHKYSNYSFDIPKKIKQGFPIEEKLIGSFWDDGFTFIEEPECQILVINSTHFHTHVASAGDPQDNPVVKGKVDKSQIESIEKYLETHNDENKIKITLCHHHPVKHARNDLGEYDFIENGESLLGLLGKYKYDLIIHGHKHDPWLRYFIANGGYSIPILASGSFSATNQISWINKFNYFHIVDLIKSENHPANGKIETWTFKNRVGWEQDRDDGFYPFTGFGYHSDLNEIKTKIKNLLKEGEILPWKNILIAIPEIEYLTPEKMEGLQASLETENIFLNSKIGLKPKHIYYDRI